MISRSIALSRCSKNLHHFVEKKWLQMDIYNVSADIWGSNQNNGIHGIFSTFTVGIY